MVFLQGANILLTDKGDVKLGKIISHFHHLLSACCNITSCLKKTTQSCHSSFQPTLELQPKLQLLLRKESLLLGRRIGEWDRTAHFHQILGV